MAGQKKKKSKMRWVSRGILLFVAAYVLAIVLPYAFPPKSNFAEANAMVSAPYEAEGQKAGILNTGNEALWGRLYLIENAQEKIRMASYLYGCDESGEKIGGALLRAANRGVKIEILIDGLIGSVNFSDSILPYALASHDNIELRYYNPLNLLDPMGINSRLHEKYMMADDRLMILGGRNISNEFLTPETHPAYNDDRDVMLWADVPGPDTGVGQMNQYFDALWQSEYTEKRFKTGKTTKEITAMQEEMRLLLLQEEKNKELYFNQFEEENFYVPVEKAVLLHNPVEPRGKSPLLVDALGSLLANAGERVWLQSPYFVLNGHMRDILKSANRSNIDFRLYTNSIASGNNIIASSDYLWQKNKVLSVGGKLYEFQKNHSSHTKCLLIDHDISVFGSFNFDMRSAYIDTEVMMVIYSEELNTQLEKLIMDVENASLEVIRGGYVENPAVLPAEITFGKRAFVYIMSPILFLVRYLL